MSAAASLSSSEDASDLRLLRDSAEAIAQRTGGAAVLHRRAKEPVALDRDAWRELGEAGFLAMSVSEDLGGLGLSLRHVAAVSEAFGRHLIAEPVTASGFLAAGLLASSEDRSVGPRLLEALARGALVPAVAWEEVSALPADQAPKTCVMIAPDRLRLVGRKRFVRPGAGFDGTIVSAASEAGVGLYWVPSDAPGLVTTMHRQADGSLLADLEFRDVPVESQNRLVPPEAGGIVLADRLDETVLMIAAELLGVLRSALSMTLDYLRLRKQFGQPIGSFQALQHRAVDLYLQQELADVAMADALDEFERTADRPARARAVSRAKARCSEAALRVTREGIQMHGAIGFTDEHDIGWFLKRAIVLSGWLGNAREHRRRYAALAPAGADA